MGSAISIGQTGLVASSKQMDVIAGNLANSTTVGYKASSILFSSVMNSASNSSGATGQGVEVSDVVTEFGQGSFEYTSSVTDMAINGGGFFTVTDPSSVKLYTRAGAFHIDNNDYLVDVNGYKVQGYTGTASSVPGDIQLQRSKGATTTTELSFGANLDERTLVNDTYNVSQTVYDSKGGLHTLSVSFKKGAAIGTWGVSATFDGSNTGVTVLPATVVFKADGTLVPPAPATTTITIAPTDPAILKGATIGTAGVLNWNLTTDANRKLTGYASASSVRSLYADGFGAGDLRSLSIDSNGSISGVYTNGQTLPLAQIGLANFQEPTALTKNGNYFLETTSSGKPINNTAGAGGMGTIQSNSLEVSNTDVSKEFISMITAQRAYQANAKIITTADQMLTVLMNIKQ
jgi:flagellar hook protein FlgE